jgi:hypothetical protein
MEHMRPSENENWQRFGKGVSWRFVVIPYCVSHKYYNVKVNIREGSSQFTVYSPQFRKRGEEAKA